MLGEIGKYVPNYSQNDGYEIAGFIWFQGWNDGVDLEIQNTASRWNIS